MGALIINQSQQAGIETKITSPIATELFNQMKQDGIIETRLIPCIVGANGKQTDNYRLYYSVRQANIEYESLITKGFNNNNIKQIDIHADSNNKTSWGCSTYFLSERAGVLARSIYKHLAEFTPWNDNIGCNLNTTFYTLRKSLACNFILEISFYDEPTQLKWMKDNIFGIANEIREGFYFNFGIQEFSFVDAIKILNINKIICSPSTWTNYKNEFDKHWFEVVVILSIAKITNNSEINTGFETTIQKAANLKIINSPGYWLDTHYSTGNYKTEFMKQFIKNLALNLK
jgi:hypothetical protein